MAIYKKAIEWHDLRIAPDDIPEEDEEVLVTKENWEGDRKVVAGVFLKMLENGTYSWWSLVMDRCTGRMEKAMLWEEVVAWAYYPDPHIVID